MAKINIIGPGYLGISTSINSSRCINLYPESEPGDSKDIAALLGAPGLDQFIDTQLGPARGMHVFNGKIYFVASNKLYAVDGSGIVSSQLGTDLSSTIGKVSMADNGLAPTGGDELAIADGINIYVYDVVADSFSVQSITANTICFIGGYFVADCGGGRWRTSDLYDGATWNALNISTADSAPDSLMAVANNHGELWLLGEYTTEVWYQSGVGNPPFARMSGGVIDYGCIARYSVAQGNNTIFWLGTKRNQNQGEFIGVCMANGYGVQVISPVSINAQISKYFVKSDARAYCYTERGHEFYVLTFPTENATWAYDTTTGLWHERSSYTDDPYKIGRHCGDSYVCLNGRHYVSDYATGNIYEMSSEFLTENGDPIVSIRVFPHLADKENLNNVLFHKLQLDMEQGKQNTILVNVFDGYTISTGNIASSTTATLTIDGTEIFNTFLANEDTESYNPLPLLLMIACNGGLTNWPTTSAYWANYANNVTVNANGTCTVALQSHNVLIQQRTANINAVMDPQDGITNPSNLALKQYPQIRVRANSTGNTFSLTLANPYANDVTSEDYEIERNPQAVLSWSDDGGHTWSSEHFANIGKQGEYNNRVFWARMGKSKNRVFRIAISDAIEKRLIAAHLDYSGS